MRKRYVVKLTQAEREQLEGLVNKGKVAAYRRKHAQALLLVDEGEHGPAFIDKDAAERTGFSRRKALGVASFVNSGVKIPNSALKVYQLSL